MPVDDQFSAEEIEAVAQAIERGIKSATPHLAKAAAMLRQFARRADAMQEPEHGR